MKIFLFSLIFFPLLAQSPQKLADMPKDKPLRIIMDSKIGCLSPIFKDNEGYVGLMTCDKAIKARYDVFSRLAWEVKNTWVCLSAKDESLDKALVLRPCNVNDTSQSFTVKDNALYTPHLDYMLELKNGILILQKVKNKQKPSYTLYQMQDWLRDIATPPSLVQKSFIAWSFITERGFDLYYMRNNESIKDEPLYLYFNYENGYIAQYNTSNAQMLCLNSTQTRSQDWNWVSWENCNFHAKKLANDTKTWEFFSFADNNEAMLKDYLGNFLRVTKYGIHWGVPYTAKSYFLAKDTDKGQTSYFRFAYGLQNWQRFVNANLSDSLPMCPAIGYNTTLQETQNIKSIVPPHFVLNEAWKRRLWQIATTTDGTLARAGDCGVCLLQSYQIIAEMTQNPSTPLESGGFFFDTEYGRNPFISFRMRYPALASALEPYNASQIPAGLSQADTFRYAAQMYRSIALSLFPGHFWIASNFFTNHRDIQRNLQSFFTQPLGTMWVVQIFSTNQRGQRSGHAIVALRSPNGVQFIPTNVLNATYENYTQRLTNSFARNPQEALNVLTQGGRINIYLFFHLQLREIYHNPLAAFISNNNCTGEGDDRRGSRVLPLSSMVNQCASGRCVIQ
ncbi:DUF1561 family protein [Campylobacter sp. MIT 21-1685]|uniref:DUF1561 family protein n=1 Tax=unclassified Campylobacter TaxID=2593542 RepID=UPI00224B988F|nr:MULTISPECIES: DUF1561 family protein [unclassified Campylobacter]MCX2683451.1 DUF1561 family protein [Campylobacter sp. MIT 21-1684]MCX2751727.1 DUF1561 family protein [Campylobacter sp. MIT 21-1682]MCX2807929.1 DUF1561 family protein [Campylobacter sp. MIT 21-1685]